MTKKLIFLILIIFNVFFACREANDSLDEIKAFKPNDKYFKANLKSLHFIIESSPISEVDSIFKMMITNFEIPADAQNCSDGIFTGESPYDAYDYKHVIEMRIKNEKIISVDYNEIHINGTGKEEDSVYCDEMSVTGTTPAEAYPSMEKQLIEKQNMMNIDAVTGATYSLYRFRYAVMTALMKARLKK